MMREYWGVGLALSAIIVAIGSGHAKDDVRAKQSTTTFRDCPICPEMVVVPAGSFQMGSTEAEIGQVVSEGGVREYYTGELPRHHVSVEEPFAVGKYEVTFAEWDACVSAGDCSHRPDDEGWGRGSRPVIYVSWDDAQEYARWLSRETGQEYRLLSEAEWEYAARAGTQTARYWGDGIGHDNANCHDCGSRWDGQQTAPVGSFVPNGFGLHDMLGNVWEWTQDCHHDSYSGAPTHSIVWQGASDCSPRVLRGGSFDYQPGSVRSALRFRGGTGGRTAAVGFRVSRTLF
jgi:formylglycine-generating enzyme required for sulfatase activity